MRQLSALILGVFLLSSNAYAFRDVTERSTIYPAVSDLIERGVLKDGSFFRATEAMPASFFWQLILNDQGFDPSQVDTMVELPPNISDTDPLGPYIREAISQGYIDGTKKFNKDDTIRRVEALKILVQTKEIKEPKKVSAIFRKKVKGVSPIAKYLPPVEAAYASQMIKNEDIEALRPYEDLTRSELVQWLYNWHKSGELKISSLAVPKKDDSLYPQYPYEKRLNKTIRTPKENREKAKIVIENLFGVPQNQELGVLNEVFNQINRKFKFQEKLDDERIEKMTNEAIAKMVEGLDDKYSIYVEPEKAKDFTDNLNGEFEGIGAYVEMVDNQFTITAPITGSPAEAAGIKAGDIVIRVDDESIEGMPIGDIIDRVKGPAGSEVKLWIKRGEQGREIMVKRGKITIPALKLEWKDGLPVIGIHQFSRDTADKLNKMLKEEVLNKNPKGIIFDLRNNPGGFLTSAVEVGQIFLKNQQRIFSAEYKDAEEVFKAKGTGQLAGYDKPMVFIQNKGSASASEILTSMIKDYKIGKIIGTDSLGKGTVQEVIQFTNGGSLKLTVAKWISPKGNWINEIGVLPDVEVADPTDEEKENKVDYQMETAIREVLGKK